VPSRIVVVRKREHTQVLPYELKTIIDNIVIPAHEPESILNNSGFRIKPGMTDKRRVVECRVESG